MVKTSSLSLTTREYWIVEGRMKRRSKKQSAALSILVPQELTVYRKEEGQEMTNLVLFEEGEKFSLS